MTGLDWSQLSWEALATFVTGALAVGGAVWVGRRQVKISEKQTDILERQMRADELTLRHDLFDRRNDVYASVELYLAHILREADYPERDVEAKFVMAMARAQFLFGEFINACIKEIWERGVSFQALKKQMKASFERDGHYGDGNPEREMEQMLWFGTRFRSLADVFGDEMRLT